MHTEEEPFHNRIDWSLWLKVFKLALPYKRLLWIIAVCAVLIGAIDAGFAQITRAAIDAVAADPEAFVLWPYLLTWVGLAVALSLGVATFILCAGNLSTFLSHDIRAATFARIQALEFAYFDHRPTGWLISRLTADCDKLSRIIAWGCLDVVWAISLLLIIAVILLVMNLKLGLIILTAIPLLLLVSRLFQVRILHSSRKTRFFNSLITAAFSEALQGMRTTRTFAREARNLQEFKSLSADMQSWSVLNATQSALYLPVVLTIGSVASGTVIWIGGSDLLAGTLSLGTLIAFIYYTGQFFEPINQVARILVELQSAQAAGERVLGLLNTEPKIVDAPAVQARIAQHASAAQRNPSLAPDGLPNLIESLQFDRVHFAYKPDEPVLTEFNLSVERGQSIALVGPSGGGKSTIISLLARFYEPTSGHVRINGIDYRERSLAWYQSQLGIVLQTPHLFAGSIAENIRYGRLDASDAEVIAAATAVNAHAFIERLPERYETQVGEGGSHLSTGQKQLISFARAILAKPSIFIMDEATSSIDTETEALIQDGLQSMLQGRFSFIIAHRLSTIRAADRILLIANGRIIESGSHSALVAQRGAYYDLLVSHIKTSAQQ